MCMLSECPAGLELEEEEQYGLQGAASTSARALLADLGTWLEFVAAGQLVGGVQGISVEPLSCKRLYLDCSFGKSDKDTI